MRFYYALLLFLISCQFVIGQNKFKDGYIIKTPGDTIYGLVKGGNLKGLHSKCTFIASNSKEKNEYYPNDILGYRFNDGRYFVSKEIELNGQTKMVFLEFLVNGIANLYSYKDKRYIYYYIEKEPGILLELKNTEKDIYIDGASYLKENKEYVYSLKSSFIDAPELFPEIENSKLLHNQLMDITEKYHNITCTDAKCMIYQKDIGFINSFGIIGGISFHKYNFSTGGYYYFMNKDEFQIAPFYSIGLTYSRRNIFGMNENMAFNFNVEYMTGEHVSEHSKISQNYFDLPLYFSYVLKNGKLESKFNFGITNSLFLKNEGKASYRSTYETAAANHFYESALGIYNISGLLGLGLEHTNNDVCYFFNINYKFGRGTTFQPEGVGSASSIKHGVEFKFGIRITKN